MLSPKKSTSLFTGIVFLLVTFISFWQPQPAQAAFEWTTVKSSGANFDDIDCIGNTCYAVGGTGAIFKSTDAGLNWSDMSQTGYDFNAVDCIDANNCFVAVGGSGYKYILKTTNGGTNWVSAGAPDSTGQFYDVAMVNTTTGFATTNGYEDYDIYRTPDQGHGGSYDWELVTNGGSYLWPTKLYFLSSSTGLWFGSGDIYRSTNANITDSYSVSWSRRYDGSAQTGDITCYDSSNCWAVGGSGFIVKSSDGGSSWGTQTSNTSNMLYGVHFGTSTTGWAVGTNGTVIKTTNGGSAWTAETGIPNVHYYGVHAIDDSTVLAVGAGGYIIRGAFPLTELPTVTEFTTGNGSTDFASEGDITQVSNMTLATTSGSIEWSGDVNADGENYDSYVNIGSGFVSLDTANLDASIDSSATVTLELQGCDNLVLYYSSNFESSLANVKANGQECNAGTTPACTNISCTNGTVTFDVPHFDGYGG